MTTTSRNPDLGGDTAAPRFLDPATDLPLGTAGERAADRERAARRSDHVRRALVGSATAGALGLAAVLGVGALAAHPQTTPAATSVSSGSTAAGSTGSGATAQTSGVGSVQLGQGSGSTTHATTTAS